LLDRAVTCGKRVFTSSRIGEKPVSVVSLAFTRFSQEVKDKNGEIFLIGAGQTNYLMSKFLSKNGFDNVHIFNRTKEKADRVADTFGWESHGLEELETTAKIPNAIIICTSSPKPLISRKLMDKARSQGSLLIIDLSVPANVPDVSDMENCHLITIEDLRLLAEENLEFRRAEIDKCEEIVEDELQIFRLLYKERVIERALRPIPNEIKCVKHNALNVVFKDRFEGLDHQSKELVHDMLNYMEKKCIAIPMKATKKALLNGDSVSAKAGQVQKVDPS
jgi:glutamyl-tRNA reductase